MNAWAFAKAIILVSFFILSGEILTVLADENGTTPLSFDGLGTDQAIRFSVSAGQTSFSVAPVRFEVEVSSQSQAKIKMWINASMRISQAEKLWGHRVDETVVRALQTGDLQTLQNFLDEHRARGSLAGPSPTGGSEFDLLSYRLAKNGITQANIQKREFYNPVSPEEREAFIKNFIGLKG